MPIAPKLGSVVQGTLDMLILKTLALEPMHAYGVGLRIEQISQGVFQVNAGSLFPGFRRLERQGWIKGEWRATENNRRAKYYRLTDAGRKKLKIEAHEWQAQSAAIARILEQRQEKSDETCQNHRRRAASAVRKAARRTRP